MIIDPKIVSMPTDNDGSRAENKLLWSWCMKHMSWDNLLFPRKSTSYQEKFNETARFSATFIFLPRVIAI